jgi:hypothetical protein
MKEQWENSKTGLQERQAEEAFRFQISSLVKREKFGLEDFIQSIRYRSVANHVFYVVAFRSSLQSLSCCAEAKNDVRHS